MKYGMGIANVYRCVYAMLWSDAADVKNGDGDASFVTNYLPSTRGVPSFE